MMLTRDAIQCRMLYILHCAVRLATASLSRALVQVSPARSGDTCAVMETNFGITLDQIRQWNSEVDANCRAQPCKDYFAIFPLMLHRRRQHSTWLWILHGWSYVSFVSASYLSSLTASAASVGSGSLLPSGGCTDYYTVQYVTCLVLLP